MNRRAVWLAAAALLFAGTEARPDNPPHVSMVPWKVLERGADVDAPLVLFWIPASREELRRSELLTSDELTLYSAQCVAMRVVRSDDFEMLEKLAAEEQLPTAVLATGDLSVIARVDGANVSEVEEMVREELDRRATTAEETLDTAREKADAGDTDAAIILYRTVWEQRCVCPRQARDAARALKKLKAR